MFAKAMQENISVSGKVWQTPYIHQSCEHEPNITSYSPTSPEKINTSHQWSFLPFVMQLWQLAESDVSYCYCMPSLLNSLRLNNQSTTDFKGAVQGAD